MSVNAGREVASDLVPHIRLLQWTVSLSGDPYHVDRDLVL